MMDIRLSWLMKKTLSELVGAQKQAAQKGFFQGLGMTGLQNGRELRRVVTVKKS